ERIGRRGEQRGACVRNGYIDGGRSQVQIEHLYPAAGGARQTRAVGRERQAFRLAIASAECGSLAFGNPASNRAVVAGRVYPASVGGHDGLANSSAVRESSYLVAGRNVPNPGRR